jgi:hypothetical protein
LRRHSFTISVESVTDGISPASTACREYGSFEVPAGIFRGRPTTDAMMRRVYRPEQNKPKLKPKPLIY